jgi:hypothetical protein
MVVCAWFKRHVSILLDSKLGAPNRADGTNSSRPQRSVSPFDPRPASYYAYSQPCLVAREPRLISHVPMYMYPRRDQCDTPPCNFCLKIYLLRRRGHGKTSFLPIPSLSALRNFGVLQLTMSNYRLGHSSVQYMYAVVVR